ncbi:MAG: hypothetical protein ACK5MK_13490 [Dysgonomonas sp.]
MTIQYKPNIDDFTELQLLATSQTPRYMKQAVVQKYLGQILFIIVMLLSGVRFMSEHSPYHLIICLIATIACIMYPAFNLWLYKKTVHLQYKKLEKKGNNSIVSLSINSAELDLLNEKGAYNMHTSDIIQFYEVGKYFFIRMHEDLFLAIPKDQLSEINSFRDELHEYAALYNIPFSTNLNWVSNIYSKKNVLN